jgi:ribonuclease I
MNNNKKKVKRRSGKSSGNRSRSTSEERQKYNNKTKTKTNSNNKQNNTNNIGLNDIFLKMIKGASTSAAAKFTSELGKGSNKNDSAGGISGDFDLFLFAQSWAPRFCCTNSKQCKNENMNGLDDLSIHGLWPAYSNSRKNGKTFPSFCDSMNNDLKKSLKGRALHEWSKHGVCTSLNVNQYLKEEEKIAEIDNVNNVRDLLNDYTGENIKITDIINELGGEHKVAIMSSKMCQLQEITTCWEKNSDGSAGKQINCPNHVLSSGRNSAIVHHGCTSLYLDTSESIDGGQEKCSFISKELLKILKEK